MIQTKADASSKAGVADLASVCRHFCRRIEAVINDVDGYVGTTCKVGRRGPGLSLPDDTYHCHKLDSNSLPPDYWAFMGKFKFMKIRIQI